MANLNARERRILRLRFFDGCSQQAVAQEMGLSQMHISRLERTAFARLRGELSLAGMAPLALPAQ